MKKHILKHWLYSFDRSNFLLLLVGPHCFDAEKSAITLYFGAAPAIPHSVDIQEKSQQTSGNTQPELSSCGLVLVLQGNF